MKLSFKFFQIVLLIYGVCVAEADEVKTVSVMEGESVTLNTGLAETQGIILILWRFGESGSTIAQIDEKDISYPSHIDLFAGKLQLDQTGSLTIKNMRPKHSGLYKVQIDLSSGTSRMIFNVTVSESPSVVDVGEAEMKSVSVFEGNSVTLQTDVTETHGDELIVWRFGDEGKLIAKYDVVKSSPLLDTDERFRDRLKMDHQTGSLTITYTTNTDSGEYTLKINSNRQTLYKRFIVTVSAFPSSGPSPGAIVGIVVAVLVAAAPVVAVIFKRNRRSERQKQIDSMKPETVKCKEGECAVLRSYQELIKRGVQMRWTRVFVKESAIASISKTDKKKTYWCDERFGGRLQLDPRTGSLIIRNLRKTDAGVYVLEIKSRGGTIYKKYEVIISGEVEMKSVKEGGDVTLELSEDVSDIEWIFTDSDFSNYQLLISNVSECPDGRFRDNLQLDKEKGSLTIKNIRTEHTGLYVVNFDSLSNPDLNFKPFGVVFDDFTETSENESVITGFLGRILRFCGQARTEGVFGDEKDEVKTLSVTEAGDLKLRTETEIETDDEIILRFGEFKDSPYITLARFSKPGDEFISENWGLKDRLQWNLTGPLTITITDFSYADCGDYYVQITNKKKNSFKSFTFIVVRRGAVKSELVIEGDSINLVPPISDLQKDDQVLWTFGPHGMIIADTNTTRCVGRFKSRVKLDKTTGSLTITESTTADTGEYNLHIISRDRVTHQRFNVTVDESWDRPALPPPSQDEPESVYANDTPILQMQPDSSGNRKNESVTVVMPLLRGENEQEGMSSL
ncbi:uncharacterized protein LOC120475640 [Pimephales promelas]|uniref:uncharacterized protein LOC120475640 n=1 Tax=Pimephales promelas TaxID=90988 RepID=UPI00195571C7|nr:uncharacterized protein LOC120475640 [Pimephales promelas]KAG1928788.1 hypothetical protein F2P79_023444 [Pimephales promelas]